MRLSAEEFLDLGSDDILSSSQKKNPLDNLNVDFSKQSAYDFLGDVSPGKTQPVKVSADEFLGADDADNDSGFIGDTGRLLASGSVIAAQNIRELEKYANQLQPIKKAADWASEKLTGQSISGWLEDKLLGGYGIDRRLEDSREYWREGLSNEQKAAMEKDWWDDEAGWFGPAWEDPRAYYGGAVESIPEMVLTMGPSMKAATAVAKGAYQTALSKEMAAAAGKVAAKEMTEEAAKAAAQKAASEAAAKAAERAAWLVGGAAEGSLAGAATSREVRDQISALDDDVLMQSEAIQALIAQDMSLAEAKEALANDMATRAFAGTAILTGVFGGMGDRALAGILTDGVDRNIIGRIVKGGVGEGLLEEFPQSAGQSIVTNLAVGEADESRGAFDGTLNEALGGLATGTAMGSAIGGAARSQGNRVADPGNMDDVANAANQPTNKPMSPDDVTQYANSRLEELERKAAETQTLTPKEYAEREFLRDNKSNPDIVAAAYRFSMGEQATEEPLREGMRDQAKANVEPLTPEDEASPIPNELIQGGREEVADSGAVTTANKLLSDAGLPPVGTILPVRVNGQTVNVEIQDAYSDNGKQGANLRLPDGTTISKSFASMWLEQNDASQPANLDNLIDQQQGYQGPLDYVLNNPEYSPGSPQAPRIEQPQQARQLADREIAIRQRIEDLKRLQAEAANKQPSRQGGGLTEQQKKRRDALKEKLNPQSSQEPEVAPDKPVPAGFLDTVVEQQQGREVLDDLMGVQPSIRETAPSKPTQEMQQAGEQLARQSRVKDLRRIREGRDAQKEQAAANRVEPGLQQPENAQTPPTNATEAASIPQSEQAAPNAQGSTELGQTQAPQQAQAEIADQATAGVSPETVTAPQETDVTETVQPAPILMASGKPFSTFKLADVAAKQKQKFEGLGDYRVIGYKTGFAIEPIQPAPAEQKTSQANTEPPPDTGQQGIEQLANEAKPDPKPSSPAPEVTPEQSTPLTYTASGKPFKTSKSASLSAKSRKGDFEVVEVDGGFALRSVQDGTVIDKGTKATTPPVLDAETAKLESRLTKLIERRDSLNKAHMEKYRSGSATRAQTTTHNARVADINEQIQEIRNELKARNKPAKQKSASEAKPEVTATAEANQPPKPQYGKKELRDELDRLEDQAKDLPISVVASDIPYQAAFDAYRNISHSPEDRALQTQIEYISNMIAMHERMEKSAKRYGMESDVAGELARYKEGYIKHYLPVLSAKSRTMSSMITGPARFPTARNQKRLDAEQKRWDEFSEWNDKAIKAIRKRFSDPNAGPVSSTDPDAISKLKSKLESLQKAQEQMKAGNKLLRSKKLTSEEKAAALRDEVGLKPALVDEIMKPDYAGRTGFPSFSLQNNNAEIKRIQGRIAELEARQQKADEVGRFTEVPFDGGTVELNYEDGYLRISHDDKPSAEVRSALKKSGFRWTPSESVWRRKLTRDAISAAERITEVSLSEDPRFSRERLPSGSGMAQQDAQSITDEVTAGWSNAPKVNVIQSVDQLPKAIYEHAESVGALSDVRAVYWKGEMHFVADRFADRKSLEEAILHEGIGHHGLRALFGKDIEPYLERVYLAMARSDRAKEIKARYFDAERPFDAGNKKRRMELAEELLAHMAESGKHRNLWNKIVSFIRDALRRMNFTLQINDKDLLAILREAEAVVKDGGISRMDGAPAMSRGESDADFKATEKAYGGKQAWQNAKEAGRTKLNYRQWIQVRTAAFKRWFGDWEAAHGVKLLNQQEPLNLDGGKPLKDKAEIKEAFRGFGKVKNSNDQRSVVFPSSMAGKIERHKGFDTKSIAGAFDQLFKKAIPMPPELEHLLPGHKDHSSNIESYRNYVNKFSLGGKEFYIRFTIQKMRTKLKAPDSNIAHSTFISDVGLYEVGSSQASLFKQPDSRLSTWASSAADLLDFKLSQWLESGNPDTVSKAVDPTTGEPLASEVDKFSPDTDDIRFRRGDSDVEDSGFDPDIANSVTNSTKYTPPELEALRKFGLAPKEKQSLLRSISQVMTRNRLQVMKDDLLSRANEGLFEGLAGWRRAEQEAGISSPEQSGYLSARLASGVSDVMTALLKYGAPMWQGNVLVQKPDTEGLLDVLAEAGKDLDTWLAWMGANRAQELMAQGRENNLTQDDIDTLLNMAAGKKEKFERIRQKYLKLNRAMLDVAVGAGTLDQSAREKFESDWYVPFYRAIDDEDADGVGVIGPTTKRGFSHQAAAIKALRGSEMQTNDLLENIITNWLKLVDSSMKNKALLLGVDNLKDTRFLENETFKYQQAVVPRSEIVKRIKADREALISVAESLGMPAESGAMEVAAELMKPENEGFEKLWAVVAPRDPDVIRVQRNGKNEYYKVKDPALLRAITHMNSSGSNDILTKGGRKLKRILTTSVTASPEFMLRNFIRDAVHAWAINPDKFTFGYDSIKGLKDAFAEDRDYRALMFAGASFQGGYVHGIDPEASAHIIRRVLRAKGLNNRQQQSYMDSLVQTPKQLWDALGQGWEKYRGFGDKVENTNRLSTFKRALEAGKPISQALFEAKDLMDYSQRGNFQALVLFTDLIPFLNARMQGLHKLGRAAKENPLKVLLGTGLRIAVWSVVLALLNGDNEEYQALPDWDKDANWHLFIFGLHFRMPKPFEIGVMFGTIPERMTHAFMGTQSSDKLAWSLKHNIISTFNVNPIPQALLPLAEVAANRSFFFDRPIEGMADEGKRPEARYGERTSDVMRALGEWTGTSPKKLEHLYNGYLGTLGSYVLAGADAMARQLTDSPEKPSLRPEDYLLVRTVYRGSGPAKSTQYQTDLYDRAKTVDEIYRTINAYYEEKRYDMAEKLEVKHKSKLEWRRDLNAARRTLSKINTEIKLVSRSRISGDEKRARLDELQAEKNEAAARIERLTRDAFSS